MDDQLDEALSLNRELEGSKASLEHQLQELEKQLNDERKSREKTSKNLEDKNKALAKLKEVIFLHYMLYVIYSDTV